MKKFNPHIWSTVPAISTNIKEIVDKINEMQEEIETLKSELSRYEKKYPNPRNVNPYDANRGGLKHK